MRDRGCKTGKLGDGKFTLEYGDRLSTRGPVKFSSVPEFFPGQTPYRGEPPAKFENDWYDRYRSGSDQTWGSHTTLPDN